MPRSQYLQFHTDDLMAAHAQLALHSMQFERMIHTLSEGTFGFVGCVAGLEAATP